MPALRHLFAQKFGCGIRVEIITVSSRRQPGDRMVLGVCLRQRNLSGWYRRHEIRFAIERELGDGLLPPRDHLSRLSLELQDLTGT